MYQFRELEEDALRLKSLAIGLLNDMGGGGASLPEDVVSEVCRFGASEIHCVASIVGGIASQECIKVPNRSFLCTNLHYHWCILCFCSVPS